jgi:hypothetical protein
MRHKTVGRVERKNYQVEFTLNEINYGYYNYSKSYEKSPTPTEDRGHPTSRPHRNRSLFNRFLTRGVFTPWEQDNINQCIFVQVPK